MVIMLLKPGDIKKRRTILRTLLVQGCRMYVWQDIILFNSTFLLTFNTCLSLVGLPPSSSDKIPSPVKSSDQACWECNSFSSGTNSETQNIEKFVCVLHVANFQLISNCSISVLTSNHIFYICSSTRHGTFNAFRFG